MRVQKYAFYIGTILFLLLLILILFWKPVEKREKIIRLTPTPTKTPTPTAPAFLRFVPTGGGQQEVIKEPVIQKETTKETVIEKKAEPTPQPPPPEPTKICLPVLGTCL